MSKRIAVVVVVSLAVGASALWFLKTPLGVRVFGSDQRSSADAADSWFTFGSGPVEGTRAAEPKTGADLAAKLRASGFKPLVAASSNRAVKPNAPTSIEPTLGEVAMAAQAAAQTEYVENGSRDVTPEEQAVLEMYENIAAAFDQNIGDCKELGNAVSEFVRDNQVAVHRLATARANLSPAQQHEADARLEREAAAQLTKLRQSMRIGLGKCPAEPRLQEAIRAIAAAGAN